MVRHEDQHPNREFAKAVLLQVSAEVVLAVAPTRLAKLQWDLVFPQNHAGHLHFRATWQSLNHKVALVSEIPP